ncbi:hypothetical protein RB195_004338 [Necator americanus]|uniref:ShKT domain-containing protein n=1 Tax=Necator americanus TaxID=51031 RepID=A0ABR1BKU0_NECAM
MRSSTKCDCSLLNSRRYTWFTKLHTRAWVDGCFYAGVEIKTHKDLRLTGYRFCAPEDKGVTLVSNYHIVPVITYNRIHETQTVLKYRIAPDDQTENTTEQRKATKKPEASLDCKDDERFCPQMMKLKDYCNSNHYSKRLKERICKKSCKLCRMITITTNERFQASAL